MFIKKSFVDEIADSLEINLDLAYKREEIKTEANRKSVLNYLTVASGILDEIGLEKEAVNVIKVLKKIADADPAAPKSSEQALSNLEHKGWMFNTDDEVQCADDDEDESNGDLPTTTHLEDSSTMIQDAADRLYWGISTDEIKKYLESEGFVGEQAYLIFQAAKILNKDRQSAEPKPTGSGANTHLQPGWDD